MIHGTYSAYTNHACRCDDCRAAGRAYARARRTRIDEDFERLRDVLVELFPQGLTDDCPARQVARSAA